jgi:exonuclease III
MEKIKIVSWNWNYRNPTHSFESKIAKIKLLDPDIIVLQECENSEDKNIENIDNLDYKKWLRDDNNPYKNKIWIGNTNNPKSKLGIGIFSKPGIKLKCLEDYKCFNDEKGNKLKFFLPVLVSVNTTSFNLVGVWTYFERYEKYFEQFLIYLQTSKISKNLKKMVFIGDFNAGYSCQDNQEMKNLNNKNNEYVKTLLCEIKNNNVINFTNMKNPTWVKGNKKCINDFCFITKDLEGKIDVEVVDISGYVGKGLSDHCPIIITLEI